MVPVTIKRSPIVFLRTFVMIEVVALLLYFLATSIDNYKFQIYSLLPLSRLLSYQTFKFPFLSAVQFVITIFAFVSWHYESFTARTGSLTHQWGVFFKKHKVVNDS